MRGEGGGCSGAWWIEGPAQLNELRIDWDGCGGCSGGGVVRGFCCTEPQKATSKLGLTALTLVLSWPYIIIITSTYNSHVVPISNRPGGKAPIQISCNILAFAFDIFSLDLPPPPSSPQSIAINNRRLLKFNSTFLPTLMNISGTTHVISSNRSKNHPP